MMRYDCSQGKTFVGLSELQVEQTTFIEHHFYSKDCLKNYGYSDLGICRNFLENDKGELSLQRKQPAEFVVNVKIQASKIRFLENVYLLL